jgi:putative FmdB family regulatory protein
VPIYEYRCSECLHSFELRQGFDAATVIACPRCRATAQRRIQAVGIIFKGSGFYSTDNSSSHSGFRERRDEESGEAGEAKGAAEIATAESDSSSTSQTAE